MMPSFIGKIKTLQTHQQSIVISPDIKIPSLSIRQDLERAQLYIMCLETLERRVLHWKEQRACGTFWFLQQSSMGALWHQTGPEFGCRQTALESSAGYQCGCGLWGGNSWLWQRSSQQRCVSSPLHAFKSKFCLLLIVTGDLLARAESLNVSCMGRCKRERLPGEHSQGSRFIWKSKEEGKWFQKSWSPEWAACQKIDIVDEVRTLLP